MAPVGVKPRPVDKFEERRRELAAAALQTLGELGYARTSLREIAQNSPYSHGVVHYYFADKVELITYCVRQYKAECVTRYDEIVEGSSSADELRCASPKRWWRRWSTTPPCTASGTTCARRRSSTSRLRDSVLEIDGTLEHMIWQVVTRYAELRSSDLTMPSSRAYATFDGLFQQALLRHLSGVEGAWTSSAPARSSCSASPPLSSGIRATTRVPSPRGLMTSRLPPTICIRSAKPRSPVPLAGSAPPMPSSRTSMLSVSSSMRDRHLCCLRLASSG